MSQYWGVLMPEGLAKARALEPRMGAGGSGSFPVRLQQAPTVLVFEASDKEDAVAFFRQHQQRLYGLELGVLFDGDDGEFDVFEESDWNKPFAALAAQP